MPSTVIRRFEYLPDTKQLWVEFTTGRRYIYSEVPEDVVAAFRSAFSKGIFFNANIRNNYPHQEVFDEPESNS